jgi:hypothetical protein
MQIIVTDLFCSSGYVTRLDMIVSAWSREKVQWFIDALDPTGNEREVSDKQQSLHWLRTENCLALKSFLNE